MVAQAYRVVQCAACGKAFAASKPNAKYCAASCRKTAQRRRDRGEVVELPTASAATPAAKPMRYADRFVESVRRKLEEADRLEEPLSLLALSLAEDSVNPSLPPASRKAFTAEFRATFAEAMRGVRVGSQVDELKGIRDARRAGIA